MSRWASKKCEKCGKEIRDDHYRSAGRIKYCSPCKILKHREWQRKADQKKRLVSIV